MDKQQEATAPPNYGDQPPPYPGTDPNAKQFAGGFSQPPPGKKLFNQVLFINLKFLSFT